MGYYQSMRKGGKPITDQRGAVAGLPRPSTCLPQHQSINAMDRLYSSDIGTRLMSKTTFPVIGH